MQVEELDDNAKVSETLKLDTKNKNNRFPHLARSSNIYSSLPSYRSNTNRKATGLKIKDTESSNIKINLQRFNKLSTRYEQSKACSFEAMSKNHLTFPKINNVDDSHHSFGLSNDLSTESIKKACQHYDDDDNLRDMNDEQDDLSDDDLIETYHTPQSFQKMHSNRRSLRQQVALTIDRHRNRCKLDEHPLCTLPRNSYPTNYTSSAHIMNPAQKILPISTAQDEVIDVLNELDAILNGHDASSSANQQLSALGPEVEKKIEACLLDLDNYLDGIDDDDDDDSSCVNNVESEEAASNSKILAYENRPQHIRRLYRTLPKSLYIFPEALLDDDCVKRISHGQHLRRALSVDMKTDRYSSVNARLPESSAPNSCLSPARSLESQLNLITDTLPQALPTASPHHISQRSTTSENPKNIDDTRPSVEENLREICLPHHMAPTAGIIPNGDLRRCYSQSNLIMCSNSIPVASSNNPTEMLTTSNILDNILRVQNEEAAVLQSRPRQYGRRALDGNTGRVFTMHVADAFDSDNRSCPLRSRDHSQRPTSAPAIAARQQYLTTPTTTTTTERISLGTTRNVSPVSLMSSITNSTNSSRSASNNDDSSSTTTTTLHGMTPQIHCANNETCRNDMMNGGLSSCDTPLDPDNIQMLSQPGINAYWPHSYSRTLALISCCLGLFNISRFAILTVQYGGNFLLQFLLLSIIFGIPLLWLQMSLGARIKAGPVTMWKISPICKGIGIALMLVQCILTIYSSIGLSWVLVYLRDSFLEKKRTEFPWQEPFFNERHFSVHNTRNLTETVADYFNGFVLRRLQLVIYTNVSTTSERFQVNDRLAFNLALIWSVVFLVLCKGLKSYGKVIFGLAIVPFLLLIAVTIKLLTLIDLTTLQNVFSAADFEEFLINSKTWSAAAQETFLTWALWGPSVISISSRFHATTQSKSMLRRDAILVVLATLFGLIFSALFGLACLQILNENDFIYVPGSYEYMETYTSVYSLKASINPALISFPTKFLPHYSSLLGEVYYRPTMSPYRESGYQALRLISELFPASVALCSPSISWIWVAITFGMFLLFGLVQMCAMWKPISSALGNSTSSVLLSCVTGLLLSIPFSTEIGIVEVYYMDLVLGGSWILPILWTALIFGVFLIRGRPYNGDDLVNDLRLSGSFSAFLALSWNVLLPIGLVTLAVTEYKTSRSFQLYQWRGKSYFSLWARKLAGLLQIAFMMIVPITALFQILFYLTNGPPDILDRIQLLYRPPEGSLDSRATRSTNQRNNSNRIQSGIGHARNDDAQTHRVIDDAPPKYTPPPSYTTATGARLAKLLRQSIRRSVRRLINTRTRGELSLTARDETSLPPEYAVLHMSENIEIGRTHEDTTDSVQPERALSLDRNINSHKFNSIETTVNSQSRPRSHLSITNGHHLSRNRPLGRPYTAEDVATILRSSTRRSNERQLKLRALKDDELVYEDVRNCSSYSSENLILKAEPLGESSAIAAMPQEQNESEDVQRRAKENGKDDGGGSSEGSGDGDFKATVI